MNPPTKQVEGRTVTLFFNSSTNNFMPMCTCGSFISKGIPCRHYFCVLAGNYSLLHDLLSDNTSEFVNKKWTKSFVSDIEGSTSSHQIIQSIA